MNMSECDFRALNQAEKLGNIGEGCQRCKQLETQYLKSEAKYLKAVDKVQHVQNEPELTN